MKKLTNKKKWICITNNNIHFVTVHKKDYQSTALLINSFWFGSKKVTKFHAFCNELASVIMGF